MVDNGIQDANFLGYGKMDADFSSRRCLFLVNGIADAFF